MPVGVRDRTAVHPAARTAARHPGQAPVYCEQADEPGQPVHNPLNAWRAKTRGTEADGADSPEERAPVATAIRTASGTLDRAEQLAAALRETTEHLAEALATAADLRRLPRRSGRRLTTPRKSATNSGGGPTGRKPPGSPLKPTARKPGRRPTRWPGRLRRPRPTPKPPAVTPALPGPNCRDRIIEHEQARQAIRQEADQAIAEVRRQADEAISRARAEHDAAVQQAEAEKAEAIEQAQADAEAAVRAADARATQAETRARRD